MDMFLTRRPWQNGHACFDSGPPFTTVRVHNSVVALSRPTESLVVAVVSLFYKRQHAEIMLQGAKHGDAYEIRCRTIERRGEGIQQRWQG